MKLTELLEIEAMLRRDYPYLKEYEIEYVIQQILEASDEAEEKKIQQKE